MKKAFRLLVALLFLAMQVGAQSNAPVRLAIITETEKASTADDLLTAEFSKNSQVTLLERNQIDKVYREQAFSAGNRDYLKLGEVLGADGLLLIQAQVATTAATPMGGQFAAAYAAQSKPKMDLSVRLVAVKSGVLLASEQFSGVDDVSQWANGLGAHLNPLLPKLSVLVPDAVPISVVNLRSAMKSPQTEELERQLTSLTIERLTHERQLFVLERRKMQLLAGEKQLKGLDDSAFWNGSYLLDGTIDRNGYSKDTITLSAQLTPQKGGTPVAIEVSGSRTNLSEVVDQLAGKVREALKLAQTAAPWNAADEAQKYFEEAKWALRWNLLMQAQNAADSAWTLGKQDLDCATVRVTAYLAELNDSVVKYQQSESSISPGYSGDGKPNGPPPTDAAIEEMLRDRLREFSFGALYREQRSVPQRSARIFFSIAESRPQEIAIERAMHVLELYDDFARSHSDGQPRPGTEATSWKIPDWTRIGIEALIAASEVLRDYNFAAETQKQDVSNPKLADLRAMVRSTADLFSENHSIRQGYFFEGRPATHDELCHTLQEEPNFFACEVNWGCFWQEKPRETIALYRELLGSAAFCYLHKALWDRDLSQPRLVGWSEEDRRQIPILWGNFMLELNASTNFLWQMEAKALEKSDAKTEEQAAIAETNWWTIVRAHQAELVANPVDLFYLGWGFAYTDETREMEQEYWLKTVPALHATAAFEKQKQYLADFTPYDFAAFNKIFLEGAGNYTKSQAAELKPLVEAYRSNILAHATNTDFRSEPQRAASWIKSTVEDRIERVLNAQPQTNRVQVVSHPAPIATPVAPPSSGPAQLPQSSNIVVVTKFLPIPIGQLPAGNFTNLVVFGHRVRDDKLLLDLRYEDESWEPTTNGWHDAVVYREAAAILNPRGNWSMIPSPHYEDSIIGAGDFLEGSFGVAGALGPKLYLELFDDALYVSDRDAIRRYDMKQNEWRELPFPGQARAQLFAVNGHLYASSSEGIWEILDEGRNAKILASTRRRPAGSALDSRDTLGKPMLFAGKEQALWAALGGEVVSWDNSDWKTILTVPGTVIPEIHENIAFFWAGEFPQTFDLWRFAPDEAKPVLCVQEVPKASSAMYYSPTRSPHDAQAPLPLWKLSTGTRLVRSSVAMDGASIYLMTVPMDSRTSWTSDTEMEDARRGLQPELVCLVPGISEPLTITIQFDSSVGPKPVLNRMDPGASLWMESSSETLFIGGARLSGTWVLPKTQIRAELDRQIKSRPPASRSAAETTEQRKNALLAKYDLNLNGKIDPEEREAAINDPAFLEFDVDNIDTNHNGMLDVDELSYFDANNNGRLDPAEAESVRAFQQILAARALKEFDWDENGRLDGNEFSEFTRNKACSAAFQAMQIVPSHSEVERIQHYLEGATEDRIEQKLQRMIPGWNRNTFFGWRDPRQADPTILSREINMYWAKQNAELSKEPAP